MKDPYTGKFKKIFFFFFFFNKRSIAFSSFKDLMKFLVFSMLQSFNCPYGFISDGRYNQVNGWYTCKKMNFCNFTVPNGVIFWITV